MSLAAPAITEDAVDYSTKRLLYEWLASYFNGATHVIGANPGRSKTFPDLRDADGHARVHFDQGPPAQPLAGIEMRVVSMPGRGTRNWEAGNEQAGMRQRRRCTFNFWVRANVPSAGAIDSQERAQTTADLLFALLDNPINRADLAQKGIGHLAPSAPEPIQSADYATRLVSCRAMLEYRLGS